MKITQKHLPPYVLYSAVQSPFNSPFSLSKATSTYAFLWCFCESYLRHCQKPFGGSIVLFARKIYILSIAKFLLQSIKLTKEYMKQTFLIKTKRGED